jgi:hypothetical protein
MVPISYLTVGDVETPAYTFPQPAQLDGQVALVGITSTPEQLASQPVSSGASLNVELFWQAMTEIEQDYTGFVHLVAADGTLVAQNDHQPRNGFLPTSIWRQDDTIPDTYTIVVPEGTAPGAYTLMAGMYDLETGARLPVWQDGKNMGDAFLIVHINVE